MLILPFGLYARIFKIPIVTICVVILIIFISFKKFSAVEYSERNFLRSENQYRMLEAKVKMLAHACSNLKVFNTETCQAIEKIKQKEVFSLGQPLKSLEALLDPKSTIARKQLKEFSDIIYSSKFFEDREEIFAATSDYQIWVSAKAEYEAETKKIHRENNLLSKGNFNFTSLSLAQFVHSDYDHLLGNLIFFVFLSVFVELRVGPLLYIFFFLVPGYVGLGGHILLSSDVSTPLMGASANISGIAGAFACFFWRKNMKVFLSYLFIYNKVISVPVYFFFPVLVLAGDIAGALQSKGGGGVAHLAHLFGFIAGTLFAFGIKGSDGLPKEFTYVEEYQRFLNIFKNSSFGSEDEKLKEYFKLIKINPENSRIHGILWELLKKNSDWKCLLPEAREYLLVYFPNYLNSIKTNPKSFIQILNELPDDWPNHEILKNLTSKDLQKGLLFSEQNQLWSAALNILRVLFKRHDHIARDQNWIYRKQSVENAKQGHIYANASSH